MGHSANDRTRYSAALLSSNDGQVGLPYGAEFLLRRFLPRVRRSTSANWAFPASAAYAMLGEAPTSWLTSGGVPIPGSGAQNKGYHREGFIGQILLRRACRRDGRYAARLGQRMVRARLWRLHRPGRLGRYHLSPGVQQFAGHDASSTARAPTWNGVLVEPHYVVSPQWILLTRYETIRMSQQATVGNPSNLGNIIHVHGGYRVSTHS